MTKLNPFVLGFGTQPNNYISRKEQSEEIINAFVNSEYGNNSYIITGVRGSGKSAMLSEISNYFANQKNWISQELINKGDLLEQFASFLYDHGKKYKLFLEKSFSFSFHGLSFSISGKTPISNILTLIEKMLEIFRKKGINILITIDEVGSDKSIIDFVKTFQYLIKNKYGVYLLITGLPQNVINLQNIKDLTFLLRAPKIFLRPLDLYLVTKSYENLLHCTFEKAKEFAIFTKGYAYSYQVLGYFLYKNKNCLNKEVIENVDTYLFENVYEKMWSELSSFEKKILFAIKTYSFSFNDISNDVGKDRNFFSMYRDKLVKIGIFQIESYGKLKIALPRFLEFVKRKKEFNF